MISNKISDQINRTLKRTAGIANISELQKTHSRVFAHDITIPKNWTEQ